MADICSSQLPATGNFGPAVRFAQSVVVAPASVAATTVVSQTGTVVGVNTGMVLSFRSVAPATNAGLIAVRASAADVCQFDYINPTAAGVTPTSGTVIILGI